VTVTATTGLFIRAADAAGVYFTDPFGRLWQGALDANLAVAPRPVSIDPPIRIVQLAPTDRPGRLVASTGEFVGPLEDGRFTGSFDTDFTEIHTAVTTSGRVMVAAGINLLELVEGELEFRTLVSGRVVGLHPGPDGTVIVLSRSGSESGRISLYDPQNASVEERHTLDLEGALAASTAGSTGVSYLVVKGEGAERESAVHHWVPGFGPCGDPIHRADDAPFRYITRVGDSVVTVGGSDVEIITFLPPSL
jgi:hypothetical protein